jgi:hypothetical protein
MTDLARMNHGYMFNFNWSPITLRTFLQTGWRTIGPFRTICRPAGEPNADLRARSRKADARVSATREPRPADMAALVAGAGWDGRMRHVRDQEYLTWRYRNPRGTYAFLYWEDAALDGYMVLHYAGGEMVWIVDWEVADAEVLEDLLCAAVDRCHSNVLVIWSATLDGRTQCMLKSAGFSQWLDETRGVENYRPGVLVRAVGDGAPGAAWAVGGRRLPDLGNWDLRMIYSDAF